MTLAETLAELHEENKRLRARLAAMPVDPAADARVEAFIAGKGGGA